jgi:hypothetical protein
MDPTTIAIIGGLLSAVLGALKLSRELWVAFRKVGKILDSIERTEHLVTYHLGPNSGSPAMTDRISALEGAIGGGRALVKKD